MRNNQAIRDRLRFGMGQVDDLGQSARAAEYGYFSGSTSNPANRITFSTGTTASFTAANLSQARDILTGLSDKTNYGYFLGGTTSFPNRVATADRITFSTGTTAAFTAANLSVAAMVDSALSDGINYGYIGGLNIAAGNNLTTTVNRITFSTGTTAAFTAANLSLARDYTAGLSDGTTYGYFAGGNTGAVVATADRITFSTSTTAAYTAANLSLGRRHFSAVSDGAVYGYFAGGYTSSLGLTSNTNRITFSTGTTASFTGANLSVARAKLAGSSDGFIYGYISGGDTGAVVATTDRITFSTSTTAAFTAANLSQAKQHFAGLADYAI